MRVCVSELSDWEVALPRSSLPNTISKTRMPVKADADEIVNHLRHCENNERLVPL